MKNVIRAVAGATLLALVATVVGLPSGRGQPPAKSPADPPPTQATIPQPPPVGVSSRTIAPQAMKLGSNNQFVRVYPKDCLKPFDSTDWFVERPLTVAKVEYDEKTQELLVATEYGWAAADEDRFRASIVEKYREAGRPVEPKAISVIPLDVAAYSLFIRDGNAEYLAYATKNASNAAAQMVAFRVPMMLGADTLHQRLANPKTMPSVQLVLRAGYKFDKIAGLTVEKRALSGAYARVLETIFPRDPAKAAGPLYLDRNAEQLLHAKLKAEVSLVIRSFGLSATDEAQALKLVLAQLDTLTVPAAPLSVADLLELNETSLVLSASAAKLEANPATDEKAITELSELQSSSETVAKTAASISTLATKHAKDERKFHSEAHKLVVDGKVGVSIFSAKMHLDKQTSALTENQLKEVSEAQTYAMNKSSYASEVRKNYEVAWKGLHATTGNIAKLLTLRRVSAAGLASVGSGTSDMLRVLGSEVVFIDTAVPLIATPVVPDAVVAMEERVRAMEKRVRAMETLQAKQAETVPAGRASFYTETPERATVAGVIKRVELVRVHDANQNEYRVVFNRELEDGYSVVMTYTGAKYVYYMHEKPDSVNVLVHRDGNNRGVSVVVMGTPKENATK